MLRRLVCVYSNINASVSSEYIDKMYNNVAQFIPYALDILALTGGGRGPTINDVTPHMLGAIFWGAFGLYLTFFYKMFKANADGLLIASIILHFIAELSAFFRVTLEVFTSIHISLYTSTCWEALQNLLTDTGRILLCAAFLHFVIRQSRLTKFFIKLCFAFAALVVLPKTPLILNSFVNNGAELEEIYNPYLGTTSEFLLIAILAYCIVRIATSKRQIRWPVMIALACLLVESLFESYLNLTNRAQAASLLPISGNLQLWAIPIISYAVLQVRHVELLRRHHGIQANERLEALGQLSSGIAHDFNNHLQIILGYNEIAKSVCDQSHKQQDPLDRIEEAALKAGELIDHLLAFRRGQPSEFKAVCLNDIVTKLNPMVSRLLTPNTKLIHDLDPDIRPIYADQTMLEQVIINLVVNAKDAINENGSITISTRSLSVADIRGDTGEVGYERTQLCVSDDGIGMNESTRGRIFEPFFTTKALGKGTGLGLSTVYNVVKNHRGSVHVKSKPNHYTRIYAEFPVSEQPKPNERLDLDSSVRQSKNTLSPSLTILLAEDEPEIRNLARTLLEANGHQVLIAHDGQHAVNIMHSRKDSVDLCLFDVMMPVLTGYEAYEWILKTHPDTPVLFISGDASRTSIVQPHLPHLQKPFTNAQLSEKIGSVLKNRRQYRES